MARPIDQAKLERIKQAAKELVVNMGYGGASIAAIAKKAEVADGYLYRFYPSKQLLVEDLLRSSVHLLINKLEGLNNENISFRELVYNLFEMLFEMAKEQELDIKFMYVLMNDYNFQVSSDQRTQIRAVCAQILTKGKQENAMDKSLHEEDIFIMLIVYPITLLNMRMKNFFDKSGWNTNDLTKMVNLCTASFLSTKNQ